MRADLIKRLRDGITLGLFHPILNEAASALEAAAQREADMKRDHAAEVNDLEDQIKSLKSERDDLQAELDMERKP